AAEAGEEALKQLLERRFDEIDLLVIYIDGMQFGEHHIISAVGVDRAGHKHVLGIHYGSSLEARASRCGRRCFYRSHCEECFRTASAAFLLKRLLIVMFCDNAGHRWSGNSIQQIGYLQSWTACVSFAG